MNGNQELNRKIDAMLSAKLRAYPPILSTYYRWLINEGKTYRTAKTYLDSLMQFVRFKFGENIPATFYAYVTTTDIENYLESIQSRRTDGSPSNAAKATNWSVLFSFFQYLNPEYLQFNPVASIKRPSINKNVDMVYLTVEETARLFENIQKNANIRQKNRDMCIFMLGFYCGLSSAAIVQLNLDNIDLENNAITIYDARNESVEVQISTRVKDILRSWIEDRELFYGSADTRALFVSQENHRISARAISDLIEKYSDGIEKHITTQVMRNTCVINLYKETGDIRLCQQFMNHASVSTTQRYIEQLTSNKSVTDAVNIVDGLFQKGSQKEKGEAQEDIVKLSGRQKCALLRRIRREIAESNGIVYLSTECKVEGECLGSCPECEAEIRYLETEIQRKILSGGKFTLAGVTLQEQTKDTIDRKAPSSLNSKLAMMIDELDFSVRTFNVLKRADVSTVGDLVMLTSEDVMKIRNMGKKSQDEIQRKLWMLGLDFKDETL